ncbi:hypothetical protein [Altererythrobacter sp.]|uniref:hypothetical protein n=1 Tax=Altererythrobacter sp. TaxID=1872480 RepID=UPI003CFBE9C2
MTTQVEVNVMGYDLHWIQGLGYYVGNFIFQQISPTNQILVFSDGTIDLNQGAGLSDSVSVLFRWLSPQVEIGGNLYEAQFAPTPSDNIWILEGNAKPNHTDNPPINGGQITVSAGGAANEIVLEDLNNDENHYTYCFAVRVGIDGGQWFVADPKIINKDVNRVFSLEYDSLS